MYVHKTYMVCGVNKMYVCILPTAPKKDTKDKDKGEAQIPGGESSWEMVVASMLMPPSFPPNTEGWKKGRHQGSKGKRGSKEGKGKAGRERQEGKGRKGKAGRKEGSAPPSTSEHRVIDIF